MRIAQIPLGIPVFSVESVVTYSTKRAPTVFERTVLRLCERAQAEPSSVLADVAIGDIFEQVLGVTGSPALLSATIEDLLTWGIIQGPAAHESLITQSVRNLQLTTKGLTFFHDNSLPSRPREEIVRHYFAPWLNDLLRPEAEGPLTSKPPALVIDPERLQPELVSERVEQALALGNYTWMTPNTEVHSVSSTIQGNAWRPCSLNIELDESRRLSIAAPLDPDVDVWLGGLAATFVWEEVLSPLLIANESPPPLKKSRIDAARTMRLLQTGEKPATMAEPAVAAVTVLAESEGESSPSGVVIVLDRAITEATWENDTDRRVVLAPWTDKIPDVFSRLTFDPSTEAVVATVSGRLPIIWAGHPRMLDCQIELGEAQSADIWSATSGALRKSLTASKDVGLISVPGAWGDVKSIDALSKRIQRLSLTEQLDTVAHYRSTLTRLNSSLFGHWVDTYSSVVGDALATAVDGSGVLPFEAVAELLTKFPSCFFTSNKSLTSLQLRMLDHLAPLEDIASLALIRRSVGPEVPIPGSALGAPLIGQLAAAATAEAGSVADGFYGPHPLAEALEELRAAYVALDKAIGIQQLAQTRQSGSLAISRDMTLSSRAAANWLLAAEGFTALVPSAGTDALETVNETSTLVHSWRSVVEACLAPALPSGTRAVVFDTSALMDDPALISDAPECDLPVVPLVTLEELDGLKRNPEKRAKAQRASRAVEEAADRVALEGSMKELLPADLVSTENDNLILSVALKFCLSEALLVAGDGILRNKARSVGRNAISTREYRKMIQSNGSAEAQRGSK